MQHKHVYHSSKAFGPEERIFFKPAWWTPFIMNVKLNILTAFAQAYFLVVFNRWLGL